MEKLGIEDLKLATKFGLEFGMALEKSLPNGLGVEDISHFLPVFVNNAEVFTKFGPALKEAKDLDAAEMAELVVYAKDVLKLENVDLEKKIERSLEAIVVIYNLVELFKPKAVEAPALAEA